MDDDAVREVLARHSAALIETAGGLDDIGAPSRCDGWTRGHVLTHLARNADGIGRLVDWAVTGVRQEMYAGGTEGRDAEIEEGAGRPLGEQLADVANACAALAAKLPGLEHAREPAIEARGGRMVAPRDLPIMRLREVVYHHVDLRAGYDFADVDPDLVTAFLKEEVARLDATSDRPALTLVTSEGDRYDVGGGGPEVTGTAPALLLWLARRDPSGVAGEAIPDLPKGA